MLELYCYFMISNEVVNPTLDFRCEFQYWIEKLLLVCGLTQRSLSGSNIIFENTYWKYLANVRLLKTNVGILQW